MTKAHDYKCNRYASLKLDLEDLGYKVNLVPFEITSLGHVTKGNKHELSKVFKENSIKVNGKQLMQDMAKISLLCSYSIFHAHQEDTWTEPKLLLPNNS